MSPRGPGVGAKPICRPALWPQTGSCESTPSPGRTKESAAGESLPLVRQAATTASRIAGDLFIRWVAIRVDAMLDTIGVQKRRCWEPRMAGGSARAVFGHFTGSSTGKFTRRAEHSWLVGPVLLGPLESAASPLLWCVFFVAGCSYLTPAGGQCGVGSAEVRDGPCR